LSRINFLMSADSFGAGHQAISTSIANTNKDLRGASGSRFLV
jgi:hypothetical protein